MGLRNQFLATGAIGFLCINIGLLFTWPSSTYLLFGSENTTLSRPMTENELSLFMSLPNMGSLVVTPFSGYVLDAIGRKKYAIAVSVIHMITYTIRVFTKSVEVMLFSCFLAGVGGCASLVAGVYIGEFAQNSVRGALTSSSNPLSTIGTMISYWIGGTLYYNTANYICFGLGVLATIMMCFLKESPTYLMKKGLEEEATKSMAFYRNADVNSTEVKDEINNIKKYLSIDGAETDSNKKSFYLISAWRFARKSKSTQRAFVVCFVVALLVVLQGLPVIQVYSVPLFTEAVPSLSSTLCSILVAAVTILCTVISGFLSDVTGRKVLLMYGSLISGLCCVVLGSQLQVSWGPQWLTALLIVLYIGTISLGALTIHFVFISEMFLPEIKGIAIMLILETKYVANFVMNYIYTPVVNLIGLAPLFYIFATVCFLSAIFTFLVVPETKGLPVDAIQLLFLKDSEIKSEVEDKKIENEKY